MPFSARLARENGWSQDFARRVIEEYKRFLFLVSVSDHMLTPSEAVDEAWHLHLVYSQSYWEDLCGKVLERPLHHQPTNGGQAQAAHFRDCYERTLDAYEDWFSIPAPKDIWPRAAVRFAVDGEIRRVNTADVWIVKKAHVEQLLYAVAIAAFITALLYPATLGGPGLIVAACASMLSLFIG
ncbi:MAG: hypothetical protein MUF20_14420, partial [Methylotetracoccus sp.]|nr:hypothetical protein [Methylotetracoccus sp.]